MYSHQTVNIISEKSPSPIFKKKHSIHPTPLIKILTFLLNRVLCFLIIFLYGTQYSIVVKKYVVFITSHTNEMIRQA